MTDSDFAGPSGLPYLSELLDELARPWPGNRTVNIVCHGHSVPAGYFATPFVNSLAAYPALLHRLVKERFPFAVLNCIVTAIGGEHSVAGAARFETDVLRHAPSVVTIDYALNDRVVGLDAARAAWAAMIEAALARQIKVILLTPSWERSYFEQNDDWQALAAHAEQVRGLAAEYQVGLADSFEAFRRRVARPQDLVGLLSHVNHPSEAGHRLIADELGAFFLAR